MKFTAAVFLVLWTSAVEARAALGLWQDSVAADAQALKGNLTTKQMPGYTVQQITRTDGTVLREFVSPEGRVFGIGWQGPTMPNFPQLLGPSYVAFQQATQSVRRRGPLSVHAGQLVVETGGHLRAFHVRAYLADLLPSGISQGVVQ